MAVCFYCPLMEKKHIIGSSSTFNKGPRFVSFPDSSSSSSFLPFSVFLLQVSLHSCPVLLSSPPHLSALLLPWCVSVNTVQYILQCSASILSVSVPLSFSFTHSLFTSFFFFCPPLSHSVSLSLSFHQQWPPNRPQSGLMIYWLYVVCEMMAMSLYVCVNAVLGLALTVHVGVDITLGWQQLSILYTNKHTHRKCRGIRVTTWHPVGDLYRFSIQIQL